MNFTLRIPLNTNAEQHARLAQLQSAFAGVCNALSPTVQQTKVWNRVALYHLKYRQLREQFPGSYGQRLPYGQTYRQRYCAQVQDQVDWSKVFFVGKLPYADYLKVLQVSAAHVYLAYPFVLSWSMLEAMSAGCLLLASNTEPVLEVIEDRKNGLLVDFFDAPGLAKAIADALSSPHKYATMRKQARETIIELFDLKTVCLPNALAWFQRR